MQVPFISGLAAAVLVGACGGEAATASPPSVPSAPTSVVGTTGATLEKSPDSGQVDRVGPDDGALRPDGVKDLAFVTQVEGPVAAIFLASVDDKGAATGQYIADTLVGDQQGPKELTGRPGGTTSGIGVFENDKMLNGPDGQLAGLGSGSHRLTLYVAATATLKAGTKLRVYLQRPDKSLVPGATLTN
jgi:hypothetical protein